MCLLSVVSISWVSPCVYVRYSSLSLLSALISVCFLSFQPKLSKYMSSRMFEHDVHSRGCDSRGVERVHVERGAFPRVPYPKRSDLGNVRAAKGGFENMTRLVVPSYLASYFSWGPKFMLPPHSRVCPGEHDADWEVVRKTLRDSHYDLHSSDPRVAALKQSYQTHAGGDYYVRRKSRFMLALASAAGEFLAEHSTRALIVEGDKGKRGGLMYRADFARLTDAFINDGISCGEYFLLFTSL